MRVCVGRKVWTEGQTTPPLCAQEEPGVPEAPLEVVQLTEEPSGAEHGVVEPLRPRESSVQVVVHQFIGNMLVGEQKGNPDGRSCTF